MRLMIGATVAAVLLTPAVGHAQVPSPGDLKLACGDFQRTNVAYQWGHYGLWLEYIVGTSRAATTCPLTVSVAAYVVGVSGSGLSSWGVFSAAVVRQVQVPYADSWQTNGLHGATWWITLVPPVGVNFELVPTSYPALIRERRRDPEAECYALGGEWDGWDCYIPNCPLIADLNHDGFKLTSVAEGVLFDLDADGVRERVAWTEPDSDEVFLAMDRNGNGVIDDGSELFGNHSPLFPESRGATAANGFEALRFLEAPGFGQSAIDGVLQQGDAMFPALLLWRDANHNGISEPEELTPVAGSSLSAISTDYKTSKKKDRYGNEFRQRAKGVFTDGEYFIYDVWLRSERR